MRFILLLPIFTIPHVFGCADHTNAALVRRAQERSTNPSRKPTDWAYGTSHDGGAIKPDYSVCSTGTQQSPIDLSLNFGPSEYHQPTFQSYNKTVTGSFDNWAYGPAFTVVSPPDTSPCQSTLKYDNGDVCLKGWHTHTPADHHVVGHRSKGNCISCTSTPADMEKPSLPSASSRASQKILSPPSCHL